jgi:hypothetical protein
MNNFTRSCPAGLVYHEASIAHDLWKGGQVNLTPCTARHPVNAVAINRAVFEQLLEGGVQIVAPYRPRLVAECPGIIARSEQKEPHLGNEFAIN